MYDAIVIGGGFYGATIAAYLKNHRHLSRVILIERESDLLTRGSATNQARVHNGYHYPRSFTTAFRSRVNLPRFVRDYPDAVKRDFTKLYAVPRRNSHVTPRHFERFCHEIGAKLQPAPQALRALFEPRLIEDIYLVEEYAFNVDFLRRRARADLLAAGVELRFGCRVRDLRNGPDGLVAEYQTASGATEIIEARFIFNCTYAGLNQFGGEYASATTKLKHEITEMALMQVPPEFEELGVTIMDGPFFSLMPFPSRGLHTLSHVRYTPHFSWLDEPGVDPYARLDAYDRSTRVDRMVRDAARYMPRVAEARFVESLFEVKTVLTKNEADDGRPILFSRHPVLRNCYSILGSKIDNIYDVLEKLDAEPLTH